MQESRQESRQISRRAMLMALVLVSQKKKKKIPMRIVEFGDDHRLFCPRFDVFSSLTHSG